MISAPSNGGDSAQVFPDFCCSSIRHCGSCRGGPHCGRCRCSADGAIVGAVSRRQRSRCKTPSHDSADNGNAKTEADGNAERNAASPDTHAPSFCGSQVQTEVTPRVLMCRARPRDSHVRSTLRSRHRQAAPARPFRAGRRHHTRFPRSTCQRVQVEIGAWGHRLGDYS